MKGYRTAVIIAVIFIALLGVALLTQPGKAPDTISQTTATPSATQLKLQIIQLPQDSVSNRLALKQADPPKSIAFKLDGKWKVEGQESFDLYSSQIDSAASQLSSLKGTQLITEKPDNLAIYGLDKPSLEITLASPTVTKTLLVGNIISVTSSYYVKLTDSETVWTIDSSLVPQLKQWLTNPPPQPTPLPTIEPATPTPTAAAVPFTTSESVSSVAPSNLTSAPTVVLTPAAASTP